MGLTKHITAIVTRVLFILVALIGVSRVAFVMEDANYWCLTILCLPLVVEMIVTMRSREGKAYKWFSPPIFLFLVSIIPSIWILEIQHQQEKSNDNPKCKDLDSLENLRGVISVSNATENQTEHERLRKNINEVYTNVCANTWILALHQILLILLIIGKWILPLGGGVTRNQLSELLLIFVGTAADILEFTSETLSDIKNKNFALVYIILAVWTWSMLQFPLNLSVVNSDSGDDRDGSLLAKNSTDVWSIVGALFLQDGPFLMVRLVVLIHFGIFHQMLVFFAIKNLLVVVLNFYRLHVICQEHRGSASP